MDSLQAGRGGAAVIIGEPGIGKTTLLTASLAYAKARDLCVVSAPKGAPGDRRSDAPAPSEWWRRLPDGLTELSARTAALLVLDDLHRLPGCLAPVLDRLLELTVCAPVLLIAAYRPRQLPLEAAAVVFRATSSRALRTYPIGALSLADTRQILGDRPDLATIHRDGHGNPAYMRMLAAGSPDTSDAAAVFSDELAHLSPTDLRVAQLASALRDPFSPDLLVAVAAAGSDETLAALDTLVARDLIRPAEPAPRLAFRHPVLADVVYALIPVSQRRAVHARIGAELGRRGGPMAARAYHVARAADPAEPAHVDTLLVAAREATDAHPDAAIGWLTVALTLIPESDGRWYEAHLLLARARLLAGQPRAGREALHTLLAREPVPDRQVRATALVLSSEVERQLGNFREADAFARTAAAALTALPNGDRIMSRLRRELAENALEALHLDRAARQATAATRHARRSSDPAGEIIALSLTALARYSDDKPGNAEPAVGRAAQRADATSDMVLLRDLSCLYKLARVEAIMERIGDAERHLERGVTLCRSSGQSHVLPAMLKTLGDIQLRLGRLARGLETLDEAAHLARISDDRPSQALVAGLRANALVWLRAGADTAEAVAAADEAVRVCDGLDTTFAVVVRAMAAEALVHAGEPERGIHLTLRAAGGRDLPRLPAWRRSRQWELLAYAEHGTGGEPGAADGYARRARRHAGRRPSPLCLGYAGRAEARAHGLHGNPRGAAETGTAALAQFEARDAKLDAALTGLVIANACIDNRVADGVPGHLDRVAGLADACGSPRLADYVAVARRGLDATRPLATAALHQLTARESEIAALVSTGMTNSQVAADLGLSVRTVDSHLWRVYHKLGVTNRASLTRLLARRC
ncbi:LuxR C-terminal-related transcriptional regulator [Micromonospora sp. NPDC023956]|uniref:helix-turn-helix transcriptional regulator n=1 Tax=Micromonospora sp. NPDC023956 TaxID=3155722 RepID=UPI0033FC7437